MSGYATSPLPRKAIHDHWRIFLAEGVLLVVLGIGAILLPLIAGLFTTVVLAWIFLIAGIVGLVSAFASRRAPGFGWALLSSLVAIIAGVALLANPVAGLVTLTFILIAFFIADGILMIALSIAHRRELTGKWEWMLMNGIIDLVMGGIILLGLPGTLVWALGLLVGIDFVFGGLSLLAMALHARREA